MSHGLTGESWVKLVQNKVCDKRRYCKSENAEKEVRLAKQVEAALEWTPRPIAELEREAILRTLAYTGGHRAKAAQLLDIGLRTLQRKLKEYGVVGAAGEEGT